MRCSVVIPVRDQAALTRACLDSLRDAGSGFDTVVVDDGSRDFTPALLDAFTGQLSVVTHDSAVGYAGACNAGAARTRGEYLIFLNNDTIGVGRWIDALVAYADAHPSVAAVGAKLLFPDNTVQHAGVAINRDAMPFHIYAGFPGDHPAVSRSRRFAAVTGACMLVRRDAFELIGGFDESFHNCYEDTDLCLRLREHALESHLCADAVLYHLESATRNSIAAATDATPHFLARWRERLAADDYEHYLADGLIALAYRRTNDVEVSVSPELGHASTGNGNGELERVLGRRSQEIAQLRDERHLLWRELTRVAPARVSFRSDGSRLLVTNDDAAEATEAGLLLDQLERKLEPLRLGDSSSRRPTVNVLVSSLAQRIHFAGIAGAVALAGRMAEQGRPARLVVVDEPLGRDFTPPPGVEIFDATDRRLPLAVSGEDVFAATSVWTAHVAHRATVALGAKRFLFLIQEDELLFYPSGSYHALARQAYGLPHTALFSTELLRDWFARQRRGVFADPTAPPSQPVFRNPITDPGILNAATLRSRAPRGLLFYARTGGTEARNLFEVGLLGLRAALNSGAFTGTWRFSGIGAPRDELLALPGGRRLQLLARQDPGRYRAILRSHDVGLALMHSPHPSMVPIEMAAAAMATVTSTFENKNADALAAISPNLIACEPTIDAIADGLARAVAAADDIDGRLAGASFDWPRDAVAALPAELLDRLIEALRA